MLKTFDRKCHKNYFTGKIVKQILFYVRITEVVSLVRILSLRNMNFLIRLIISTLAVLITSYLLPGVHVENFMTAVIVAVVLGFLNTLIKPLLILLSLPAVVFTFGLFLIVINTLIIMLADKLVDGFSIGGFRRALLFGIVIWVVTSVLNAIKKKDEQKP